ncbi:MAG: tRNA uridine-5-carboxymethylaminomethyl(34) synthesis GTPase MnmE [Tistlia sp.]|uniref:tRNA uridine-5-carboxymethylaminomethyl(34) synthesis GTPase MnmE n=1 Tax=Tistlia sp. TaxID=3057121 RepID=UPI0034A3A254
MADRDSIFALSTPPGTGAIAVLRLSGPGVGDALEELLSGPLPPPRRFSQRALRAPDGELLDRGVVVWLPAEAGSYTGEDMAELQVHGGLAVVRSLLSLLASLPAFRPADPGEFTRRAFEAGRLDLVAAEAVADLVAAETARQRRQALAGTEALTGRLAAWEGALVAVSARLEAAIDFPDEDLPADLLARVRAETAGLRDALLAASYEVALGERLRQGFEIALVGAPNAGKSSLLNALARREAAIVHETAGTTRDVVEVRLDLAGFAVTLLDTAGLRAAAAVDPVEQEGMRRARARAAGADLVVVLFDSEILPVMDHETLDLVDDRSLAVLSKCDLEAGGAMAPGGLRALRVSAKTGEGLEALQQRLAERVTDLCSGQGDALFNRERHRAALAACAEALERALAAREPALMAEDLRVARSALGRLVGRIDVERLLDSVFREFCIGK